MMTTKSLYAVLYTALVLGANPLSAASAPSDWVNFEAHDVPKPIVEAVFESSEGVPAALSEHIATTDGSNKILVVNFWATWCAPCLAEMPSLDRLQDAFAREELEVVTIAAGRNDLAAMERFFDKAEIKNLPLYKDPKMAFAASYGVRGLPVTLILNAKTQEIARLQGDAEWDSPDAIAYFKALMER